MLWKKCRINYILNQNNWQAYKKHLGRCLERLLKHRASKSREAAESREGWLSSETWGTTFFSLGFSILINKTGADYLSWILKKPQIPRFLLFMNIIL